MLENYTDMPEDLNASRAPYLPESLDSQINLPETILVLILLREGSFPTYLDSS